MDVARRVGAHSIDRLSGEKVATNNSVARYLVYRVSPPPTTTTECESNFAECFRHKSRTSISEMGSRESVQLACYYAPSSNLEYIYRTRAHTHTKRLMDDDNKKKKLLDIFIVR